MRNIDDHHFGPDSVGKINVLYQNVKRTKLLDPYKNVHIEIQQLVYHQSKVNVLCYELYMNSFMLL